MSTRQGVVGNWVEKSTSQRILSANALLLCLGEFRKTKKMKVIPSVEFEGGKRTRDALSGRKHKGPREENLENSYSFRHH